MIIGIHGKVGSGKGEFAKLIAEEMHMKVNVYHKLFGFKLKQVVELLTGVKMQKDMAFNYFRNGIIDYTTEQKNTYIPMYDMTIGQMLQQIGTNSFRDNFGKDVWIKALFLDYKPELNVQGLANDIAAHLSGKLSIEQAKEKGTGKLNYPFWIIPDTRFPNEAEEIIMRGGFIIDIVGDPLGINKNTTRDKNHESETAMDNFTNYRYSFKNEGSLDDLREKVKLIKELEDFK